MTKIEEDPGETFRSQSILCNRTSMYWKPFDMKGFLASQGISVEFLNV